MKTECKIKECDEKVKYINLCWKHYKRYKRHGDPLKTLKNMHGMTHSDEYKTYISMKSRCYYKKSKRYKDYGGRGITVCDRWLGFDGFSNFYKDMGNRPSNNHSIDRINNDKGYSPENCRWATVKQQVWNRKGRIGILKEKYITYDKKNECYAVYVFSPQGKIWGGRHKNLKDAIKVRDRIVHGRDMSDVE